MNATPREIHWQQRAGEIANAAAQLRANIARANHTLNAVIARHEGHIGTHYEDCWKNHAGCLALMVQADLNRTDEHTGHPCWGTRSTREEAS